MLAHHDSIVTYVNFTFNTTVYVATAVAAKVNGAISLHCSQTNFSIYCLNETKANFLQYSSQIKDDVDILPQMLTQKLIVLKFQQLVDGLSQYFETTDEHAYLKNKARGRGAKS